MGAGTANDSEAEGRSITQNWDGTSSVALPFTLRRNALTPSESWQYTVPYDWNEHEVEPDETHYSEIHEHTSDIEFMITTLKEGGAAVIRVFTYYLPEWIASYV